MNIFNKTEYPEKIKGEYFSVDVITCDSDGLINIGYYNYDTNEWSFHTDTMCDYTDVDFVWIYPPIDKMRKALVKN